MPVFRLLAAIAPKDGACAHRGIYAHRGTCAQWGIYAQWGTPTVQGQDRTTSTFRNHYTGMNPVL